MYLLRIDPIQEGAFAEGGKASCRCGTPSVIASRCHLSQRGDFGTGNSGVF